MFGSLKTENKYTLCIFIISFMIHLARILLNSLYAKRTSNGHTPGDSTKRHSNKNSTKVK